jgi:lipoate-protein ligase A
MKKNWHLIIDREPKKGSWNMAVDEFLFRSLGDEATTYLRFYRWEKPTVSIGRSQKAEKVVNLDFCRQHGIDIVRRITGGKLVLHHKEVTYCVCSSDAEIFSQKLMDSYRLISDALNRSLVRMGIESRLAENTQADYARGTMPCFAQPARDEIEMEGKKIIGSAQKRTGNKFIQHGSIPLEKEDDLLISVSKSSEKKPMISMTSLSDAVGKKVDFDWAVDRFISGMSDYFDIQLTPWEFSSHNLETVQDIQKQRYENPAWTFGGRRSSPS